MTNKLRKRAPGGGRKPQGPFSNKLATLSTRITVELRERLDQETAQRRTARGVTPWSLSQEIELRLRESLELPAELQKAWGPAHIKALAQLVSRVARSVESAVGAYPFADDAGDLAWHRNPFTHAAVTAAINMLLAHYKPVGSAQTPPEVKKRAEWIERESGKEEAARQCTPESVGLSCALGLLDRLASPEPPPLNHPANEHYAEGYYVFPNIHKILSKEQKK
jgi:hypothetical protein